MKDILSSLSSLKDNKNFFIILIGGFIVVVCVIIIIYFSFFYKGKSFSEIKSVMKNASVSYCKEHCDNLFEGVSTVTVPASTLIDGGYMDDFSKLTKDKETSCTGEVIIKKAYENYNYITNLNCDDDYGDEKITDVILANDSVVESGAGIYEMNGSRVYRGEYVHNYLKLGSTMFRIVKINEDNSLMLVLADYTKGINFYWDDRYNVSVKKSDGINDYSISRARERLTNMISNTFNADIGKKAISYDYCIGERSEDSDVNDGSIECSVKYNDYISLLAVYDFINASIDRNCKSVSHSRACQNYNYLTKFDNSFWFITPVSETTSKLYYYAGGSIGIIRAKTKNSLRFVITISGDEIYKAGTGTKSDPYVIYE